VRGSITSAIHTYSTVRYGFVVQPRQRPTYSSTYEILGDTFAESFSLSPSTHASLDNSYPLKNHSTGGSTSVTTYMIQVCGLSSPPADRRLTNSQNLQQPEHRSAILNVSEIDSPNGAIRI
jgi:hypothetical protein